MFVCSFVCALGWDLFMLLFVQRISWAQQEMTYDELYAEVAQKNSSCASINVTRGIEFALATCREVALRDPELKAANTEHLWTLGIRAKPAFAMSSHAALNSPI